MSDCCSTNNQKPPRRHTCPEDNKQCTEVSYKTILHHVIDPWKLVAKNQAYYFCDNPDCDVVYFGLDNSTIRKDQLRTTVGIKETADDTLVCYCFGVSKLEAKSNSQVKAFVIDQTKRDLCSCTTHNPSGRCCLKDFPK
ncbi:MAG: hypothetical protein OEM38_05100 [Gammaproteobacteria bacterium]|nr:hypothetical protein [Gammaproteobacteria bacterium]